MGSVISCGLKLVLQIFNTVLFVAFLAVAVFGIVLKTSKGLVQSIFEKAFDKNSVTDEQLKAFAQFITDNSGGVAVVLIVVGLVLAALCLIGCIASCCGCEILLKIYAAILVVLLVVQIIAVAVVFSDPNRLSNWTIKAMNQLLQLYGDQSTDKGQMATAIWNFVMEKEPLCCAMDGYKDFSKPGQLLPPQCCGVGAGGCSEAQAKQDNIKGCRERIANFTADNMKSIMYISIFAILFQAALIVIVMLVICL
ncbi:Tetraspanin-7 [Taenia solium]|eukprot:TsM_000325600 transcript=TsM_000325600 gene=TsM_000325600